MGRWRNTTELFCPPCGISVAVSSEALASQPICPQCGSGLSHASVVETDVERLAESKEAPSSQSWPQQLEAIVEKLESAWESGLCPNVRDFVPVAFDASRPEWIELLEELIHVDWEWRCKQSDLESLEEYLKNFPEIGARREFVDSLKETLAKHRLKREAATCIEDAEEAKRLMVESAPHVAHFRLLARLGQGSFGEVWKAWDEKLERHVALKIPRRDRSKAVTQDGLLTSFLHDARAAAKLAHENIVRVFEVGDSDGVYIASELIDGADLRTWLSKHRPTPRQASELVGKITNALAHAHAANIIHRDLKPENILMDSAGQPRITDFGLARVLTAEKSISYQGIMLGSPAYMPPEQARGDSHQADARSDLYAIGVILFEMLTGERPFTGDLRMIAYWKQHATAPRLRQIDDRLPKDLDTICQKCLEREPADRFQSASELSEELHRFLDGRPILSRPMTRWETAWRWCWRHRSTTMPVAGAVAAITIVVVVTIILLARAADRERTLRVKAETLAGEKQRLADLERQARQDAVDRLSDARRAVDQWLTGTSEWLREWPEFRDSRTQLLAKAAADYTGFARQKSDDPDLRLEQGRTLLRLGDVYCELQKLRDAEQSYLEAQAITTDLAMAGLTGKRELWRRYDAAISHTKLALLWSDQGDDTRSQKAFEIATTELSALRDVDPSEPRVHEALITTQLNQAARRSLPESERLLLAAKESAENLLLRKPDQSSFQQLEIRARLEWAQALIATARLDEAREQLRRVQRDLAERLRNRSNDPALLQLQGLAAMKLCELQRRSGDWNNSSEFAEFAVQSLEPLAQTSGPASEMQMLLVTALLNQTQEAIELAQWNLASDQMKVTMPFVERLPQDIGEQPRIWELLAVAQDLNGQTAWARDADVDKAVQHFLKAIEHNAKLKSPLRHGNVFQERLSAVRGRLAEQLMDSNPEEARREFSQAIDEIRPLLDVAEGERSRINMSPWETAARLQSSWAWCEWQQKDLDSANRHLDQAIALWQARLRAAPTAQAWHSLAWLIAAFPQASAENLAVAEDAAQQALTLAPNNPWFQATLGVVRFRQQRFAEAREQFLAAIQAADDSHSALHPRYRVVLSLVEAELGNRDEAKKQLQLATAALDAQSIRDHESNCWRQFAAEKLQSKP